MKLKLSSIVQAALTFAALLIIATVIGCTTTPEGKTIPDTARIAAVCREAATIGTQQAMAAHPEWKPKFDLVIAQLGNLSATDSITVESLLQIVSQLPVNKLQSQNATLAISSARLLVAAAGWSTVTVVKAEQLRPVVIAIREGLIAGMAGGVLNYLKPPYLDRMPSYGKFPEFKTSGIVVLCVE